ncbi:hypothetical protein GCM10009547_09580 [Sporichthya brevicatena]|uniref:Flagellar hook-length control protein-like C-terminal domain-containing protein n=1 Tax=Sporichthya brevicatena TaxID=171442 RepID=A0ABN1GE45_9ACTN
MTIPTLGSLPVPVPAPTTVRTAADSGTDADAGTGSGSGSGEEFAGMVADLVAALLGTPTPHLSGEARLSPDPDGRGAPEELALAAGAVPAIPVPAPALTATPGATAASAPVEATDPGEARLAAASDGRAAPADMTSAAGPAAPEAPDAPATRAEAAPPEGPADPAGGSDAQNPQPNPNFSGAGRPSPAGEGRGAPEKSDGVTPAGAAPAAAPTSATSAVAPAAAPASATPAPPTLAAQLAAPITAVHQRGAEGTHVLSVDITPEELGPVRVELELRDGTVELRLAGQSEAARDALRAALPDLRRALEAAGIGTGSFSLGGDGGAPQPGPGNPQNGHARPAWAGGDGRVPHDITPNGDAGSPTGAPASAGSLDLQL